jgi:tetratricopeptide (TPR) repeat protein
MPLLLAATVVIAGLTMVTLGQTPPKTTGGNPPAGAANPPKTDKEKLDEQVFGQLAKAWSAFYGGKYEEGIKSADALTKTTDRGYDWVKAEAVHVEARCCWAYGTKDSQAKAKQLWGQIQKATIPTWVPAQLKISQALALEEESRPAEGSTKEPDSAKLNQAIGILEGIAKDAKPNAGTVEASIDLARLYVQAKRFDDAKKVLDSAVAMLDKQNLARLELPEGLEAPYLSAAKAGLAHLKYDKDAGRELFEKAEALRKAEKFLDAAKAYQAVMKDFPDSDYAPRSELSVGYCLIGQKQPTQAAEHWKKFVAAKPAGSWRGQAFVGLIDLCLEELLDLPEAARYGELAKTSLPTGLIDEKSADSWKAVAYDVWLRVGMVSFCQGKGAPAAEAFEAAKKLTTKKLEAESLDSLIAAAKNSKSVIPDDVAAPAGSGGTAASPVAGSAKAALSLSLGVIFTVAGRYENADAYFDRVRGGFAKPPPATPPSTPAHQPMPGATQAQLAFAIFGQGMVLQAAGKAKEAKDEFAASVKAFPDGTWHDESLYRIATIIEEQAEAKFGAASPSPSKGEGAAGAKPPAGAAAAPPGGGNAVGATSRPAVDYEAKRKAEKEHQAALAKAQGEALPYWQEIIKKYAKSPRCEPAYYQVGVILCDLAEAGLDDHARPVTPDKTEQLWKDAALALAQFTKDYPKSPSAGDAYVRQIDIALERMFDAELARASAPLAVEWADNHSGVAVVSTSADPGLRLAAWAPPRARPNEAVCDRTVYECYLRGAILAYLVTDYGQAETCLNKAGPIPPPAGGVFLNDGAKLEKVGLYYILQAITTKKEIVDPEALKAIKDDKNLGMTVRLGDLYLWIVRPDKAEPIFLRIAEAHHPFERTPSEIRSYCIAQMGLALDRIDGREAEGQEWFMRLQEPPYRGSYWAGLGLYRQAVTTFNNTQDPTKANPLYVQMIREYPQHPKTELAYTYLCLNYLRMNEFGKAEQTVAALTAAFPRSEVVTYLKDSITKAKADQAERKEP